MPFDFDDAMEKASPVEAPVTEAPKTETVVAPVPEAPKTETPPVEDKKTVPLATFLDQRDELKKLKEENEKLKPPAEEFVMPDREKDPEAYEAFRNEQFQQVVLNERLNNSEMFAIQQHGEETVNKVKAWALEKFKEDPNFYGKITGNRHPYGAAIEAYNRDQALKEVDSPEYKAWKASKAGSTGTGGSTTVPPPATPPGATAPKAATESKSVPTTIADDPSAKGGKSNSPVGAGQAFSQTFAGD